MQKRYVALSFDVDGETLWTSRDEGNWKRPVALSHGAYGPKTGVKRILNLLHKHSIKSTFFIPGWIIETYTDEMKQIVKHGHEVGHHGYLHEYPHTLDVKEEKQIIEKGIHIIEGLTGKKPKGYRSPAWEFSSNTLNLLAEYNFLYSSNMMDADDPYIHLNGVVEIPVQWLMDDAPFFMFHPD
ncbi:polysaccharide deacetylase family protein [Virgibacillus halodenitrificans]|uniref:polysaccharide deacetylase family protein n=1 Tax=Virgibacillus halodenitrificans TaxID=1482 RepID=UPI000760BD4F